MRNKLLVSFAIPLLLLTTVSAQEKPCPDIPGLTSATHRFRQEGESIEVALTNTDPDCAPVAIRLSWTNGRNNGSNFNVTFLDNNNRPISARQISGFLTGVLEFPLSSFEPQLVFGSSLEVISLPTTVRIQAVPPFAGSAILSYNITSTHTRKRETAEGNRVRPETNTNENEVVSIHDAVRLIGATRLSLVQIELRTTRPFPVRDVPLQLQIGKRVFVDELSGDYTGRRLTLSLTPEIFAELNEDDEIMAFFGKLASTSAATESTSSPSDGDVWRFGKLRKNLKKSQ